MGQGSSSSVILPPEKTVQDEIKLEQTVKDEIKLEQDEVLKARNAALWHAAFVGDQEEVCRLVLEGADVNTTGGVFNKTVLMAAARNGHSAIVEFLLNHPGLKTLNAVDPKNRNTALIYAAMAGHSNIVQELYAHGAVVNIKNREGETALSFAAMGGHDEIVRFLLLKDADRYLLNNRKKKAEDQAREKGHVAIARLFSFVYPLAQENHFSEEVKYIESDQLKRKWLSETAEKGDAVSFKKLIAEGANIHVPNPAAYTSLLNQAIHGRSIEIINYVMDQLSADIHVVEQVYNKTLFTVVGRRELDLIQMMLDRGAMVDAVNGLGYTALITLCSENWYFNSTMVNVLKFLLERGANPFLCNNQGMTVLDKVKAIAQENREKLALPRTSFYRDLSEEKSCRYKIELAESITGLLTSYSQKLLEEKNIPLSAILSLRTEASQEEKNSGMLPPNVVLNIPEQSNEREWLNAELIQAASQGDEIQFCELIAEGADIRIINEDEQTVLVCAAYGGNAKIISYLLSRQLDVNMADVNGNTALIYAAMYGYLEAVRVLLDGGARIDALNRRSNSALHMLFEPGSTISHELVATAELLLERGANPNHLNEYGRTPLAEARLLERQYTIDELIRLLTPLTTAGPEEEQKNVPEENEIELAPEERLPVDFDNDLGMLPADEKPPVSAGRPYLPDPDFIKRWNKLPEKYKENVPDEHLCPISKDIMRHPVTAPSGITYDKASLDGYFDANRNFEALKCPVTGIYLIRDVVDTLQDAILVKKAIDKFITKREKEWKKNQIRPGGFFARHGNGPDQPKPSENNENAHNTVPGRMHFRRAGT